MSSIDTVEWTDKWIPKDCSICSLKGVREDLQNVANSYPFNAWEKVIRKLSYIGALKKPISNKEYMYRIDKNYYECYIFGKRYKERLVFDFHVHNNVTFLLLLRLNTHDDVKKRKGMLKSDMDKTNAGDILTESDIDFLNFFVDD